MHGKACSGVTYGARSVTKASETVVAAEVVYHALNRMSFFASLSESVSQGQYRQRRSYKASAGPQLNR
jgi:hypothetical protein